MVGGQLEEGISGRKLQVREVSAKRGVSGRMEQAVGGGGGPWGGGARWWGGPSGGRGRKAEGGGATESGSSPTPSSGWVVDIRLSEEGESGAVPRTSEGLEETLEGGGEPGRDKAGSTSVNWGNPALLLFLFLKEVEDKDWQGEHPLNRESPKCLGDKQVTH